MARLLAVLLFISGCALQAQNPPAPAQPATPAATAQPAAAQPAPTPAPPPPPQNIPGPDQSGALQAESPTPAIPSGEPSATPAPPAAEPNFTGDIEVGYRIIPNISGNANAYRTVIDLNEGLKLFGADATIINPNHHWFDRLDLHVTSLGDEPYQAGTLNIWKRNIYRLTVDWRDIAYYDFLPSFANPFASTGGTLNENSYGTRIHTTEVRLDLFPDSRFTPYLAYGRNGQYGGGITSYVASQNNYPVATNYSDSTNDYRAGLSYNGMRFHANIEEGGTTFKDDQGASDNYFNAGTLLTPFLGENLYLTGLDELYYIRGHSVYTKASFGANPVSWASISGQFVYAEPRVNVNYNENSAGNFYYTALVAFYTSGQDTVTGSANMPHPSGNINLELRPFKRLRIEEFWMTDRLHNAASDVLSELLLFPAGTLTPTTLSAMRLSDNYNQQEIDAYFDATSKLTLRVGERYVWGDATITAPSIVGTPYESGSLSQNVGLIGISYRAAQKFRVNIDYEYAQSSGQYFRTSLRNYTKFRVHGSYDVKPSLRFGADYSLLSNSDPDAGVHYTFSSLGGSFSMNWLPKGGKWFSALLDYTRSAVQSDIIYIVPETFTPATSLYHENAHTGTAYISVRWVSFGGSLFVSSGSRPTQLYQPFARLSIPIHKHISWNAEWRYYGFAEGDIVPYYVLEGFRSNQIMTSLRFTR